eukprot:TRINITY_DN23258_c0_g1_i1.p1 TRINITY_DN23258_c0_g1~~TRINITY_DN23258_c0_g1_i1.p1  ORF type:complete len:656 (-),score=109.31 TRINITY_DN23258_c0_g1_i1:859-2826(-)
MTARRQGPWEQKPADTSKWKAASKSPRRAPWEIDTQGDVVPSRTWRTPRFVNRPRDQNPFSRKGDEPLASRPRKGHVAPRDHLQGTAAVAAAAPTLDPLEQWRRDEAKRAAARGAGRQLDAESPHPRPDRANMQLLAHEDVAKAIDYGAWQASHLQGGACAAIPGLALPAHLEKRHFANHRNQKPADEPARTPARSPARRNTNLTVAAGLAHVPGEGGIKASRAPLPHEKADMDTLGFAFASGDGPQAARRQEPGRVVDIDAHAMASPRMRSRLLQQSRSSPAFAPPAQAQTPPRSRPGPGEQRGGGQQVAEALAAYEDEVQASGAHEEASFKETYARVWQGRAGVRSEGAARSLTPPRLRHGGGHAQRREIESANLIFPARGGGGAVAAPAAATQAFGREPFEGISQAPAATSTAQPAGQWEPGKPERGWRSQGVHISGGRQHFPEHPDKTESVWTMATGDARDSKPTAVECSFGVRLRYRPMCHEELGRAHTMATTTVAERRRELCSRQVVSCSTACTVNLRGSGRRLSHLDDENTSLPLVNKEAQRPARRKTRRQRSARRQTGELLLQRLLECQASKRRLGSEAAACSATTASALPVSANTDATQPQHPASKTSSTGMSRRILTMTPTTTMTQMKSRFSRSVVFVSHTELKS